MADIVEEIRLRADTGDADRDIAKLKGSLEDMFTKGALQAAAFNQALALGRQALGFMVAEMGKGFQAAREYEKTTIALSTALQGQGRELSTHLGLLQKQSAALEDLSLISDENIRKLQSQAVNYGVATDEIDQYIRASISLANATGQDVNTVFEDLIRLQETGSTRNIALKSATKDLTEAQIANGDAIDVINEKYGEFIDLNARGATGAINQLTNAWDNLNEAIATSANTSGTFLNDFVNAATSSIKGLTLAIESAGSAWELMQIAFGSEAAMDRAIARRDAASADAAMPIVDPATGMPAGAGLSASSRSLGRKGAGKSSGDVSFDEFSPEMAFAEMEEENARIHAHNLEEMAKADEIYNRAYTDMLNSQVDHARSIEESKTRAQKKAAEERERITKKEMAAQEAMYEGMARIGMVVLGNFANTAVDAFFAMAEGQKVNLIAAADAFLKQTGRQLISSGIQHGLEATALAVMSAGANPQAAALASVAAAEIGAGTAMMAGSLIIPNEAGGASATGSGSGTGGGFAAGGGGDFSGGVGGRTEGPNASFGNDTVVININGVITSDKAGREIQDAIKRSRRKFG